VLRPILRGQGSEGDSRQLTLFGDQQLFVLVQVFGVHEYASAFCRTHPVVRGYRTRPALSKSETPNTRLTFLEPFAAVA
jgi:hypothetical protein